jgi:hypothetical protein
MRSIFGKKNSLHGNQNGESVSVEIPKRFSGEAWFESTARKETKE